MLQHKVHSMDKGESRILRKGGEQFLVICVRIDFIVSFTIISIHLLSYVVDC